MILLAYGQWKKATGHQDPTMKPWESLGCTSPGGACRAPGSSSPSWTRATTSPASARGGPRRCGDSFALPARIASPCPSPSWGCSWQRAWRQRRNGKLGDESMLGDVGRWSCVKRTWMVDPETLSLSFTAPSFFQIPTVPLCFRAHFASCQGLLLQPCLDEFLRSLTARYAARLGHGLPWPDGGGHRLRPFCLYPE